MAILTTTTIANLKIRSSEQIIALDSYVQLANILDRDDISAYRRKAILDYLIAALKCNFMPTAALLEITQQYQAQANGLIDQTRNPQKAMVYFSGTGNPVGLQNSLFDELIVNTLMDDTAADVSVIAIPGIGINCADGHIETAKFRSGHGMAERVQLAVDGLQQLNSTPKIEIYGHSRGAVQALALGKILAVDGHKDLHVVAHDPVLASIAALEFIGQSSLDETVATKSGSYKIGAILNATVEIANLLVILRETDNRSKAFAFYANENAFAATNRKVVNHPGFHNCGVFKGRTSNLNLDIMFSRGVKAVVSKPVIYYKSKQVNQDLTAGRIDGQRDVVKEFLYAKTKQIVQVFVEPDPNQNFAAVAEDVKQEIVSKHYPEEVTANPAYAVLQIQGSTRVKPNFLVEDSVVANHFTSAVQEYIADYNNAKDYPSERIRIKKLLLLHYIMFSNVQNPTNEEKELFESVFAILSAASTGVNFPKLVRNLVRKQPLTAVYVQAQLNKIFSSKAEDFIQGVPNKQLATRLLLSTPQQCTASLRAHAQAQDTNEASAAMAEFFATLHTWHIANGLKESADDELQQFKQAHAAFQKLLPFQLPSCEALVSNKLANNLVNYCIKIGLEHEGESKQQAFGLAMNIANVRGLSQPELYAAFNTEWQNQKAKADKHMRSFPGRYTDRIHNKRLRVITEVMLFLAGAAIIAAVVATPPGVAIALGCLLIALSAWCLAMHLVARDQVKPRADLRERKVGILHGYLNNFPQTAAAKVAEQREPQAPKSFLPRKLQWAK